MYGVILRAKILILENEPPVIAEKNDVPPLDIVANIVCIYVGSIPGNGIRYPICSANKISSVIKNLFLVVLSLLKLFKILNGITFLSSF